MNLNKLFKKGMFLLTAGLIFTSCESDDSLVLAGSDCNIVSMTVVSEGQRIPMQIRGSEIGVTLDYNFDFSTASVEYVISEGATIGPDPSTADLSVGNTFTVTSANGQNTKTYTYTPEFDSVESYCRQNVYLRSQEEVEAFARNGYTRVWSIVVNGTEESPVTDLSPLNSLKRIDYNLTVKGFQGSEIVLDNIMNISSIDICLEKIDKLSFASLEELDDLLLGTLNEDISEVKYLNASYVNFNRLQVVNNNMVLMFQVPENFDNSGFKNLRKVCEGYFNLIGVKDLTMFSNLEEADYLSFTASGETLEGLGKLKRIRKSLTFSFCNNLKTTAGFMPEEVGDIHINNCSRLEDVDAFANIRDTYSINLNGTPKLADISGLSNIRHIDNRLYFRWVGVYDLNALGNLESVGRLILLNFNNNLEDFSGLRKCLLNFKGEFNVQGNKKNPTKEEIIG